MVDTPLTPIASPNGIMDPMVRPSRRTVSPLVLSQEPPASNRPSRVPIWAALGAALLSFLPMTAARAQTPAAPNTPAAVARLDEKTTPRVTSAGDLAAFTRQPSKALVDLAHNPVFSPDTQKRLLKLMQDAEAPTALWVMPEVAGSDQASQKLAQDILAQLQIGQTQGKGRLILMDAKALRSQPPNLAKSVAIASSPEFAVMEQTVTDLIRNHAWPHIQNGNMDKAAQETVKALDQLQAAQKSTSPAGVQTVKAADGTESKVLGLNPDQWKIVGLILGIYLGVLGAAFATDKAMGNKDYPLTKLTFQLLEVVLRIMIYAALAGKGGSGGSKSGGGGGGKGGFSSGGGGGI